MTGPTPYIPGAAVPGNGNGNDPAQQLDVASAQRLRAVTHEFSTRELAELTGISHESVRRYLEGKAPGPFFIKRLCEVLGLSADWLLLGRGAPVYQREPTVGEITDSIDELLEGLGGYLKRLHAELMQAEARLKRAKEVSASTLPRGRNAADDLFAAPRPAPVEASPDDFVDPFAAGLIDPAPDTPGDSPPAPARGQAHIRLVLGPLSGRHLATSEPLSAVIRLRGTADGGVELLSSDGPEEPGSVVYHRVFDRVYRWQGTPRPN